LVQNLRRGHDELAVEDPMSRRVAAAFDELVLAICSQLPAEAAASACPWSAQRNSAPHSRCLAATTTGADATDPSDPSDEEAGFPGVGHYRDRDRHLGGGADLGHVHEAIDEEAVGGEES
jgi:hypothetical protein